MAKSHIPVGSSPAAGAPRASAATCRAPGSALYLFPDGTARACCVSTLSLGNLNAQSLRAVWSGARRRELARRIVSADFSMGCESCGTEIEVEGRVGSYPTQFDHLAGPGGDENEWPAMIGFYLSNVCNLQCVQCNGESSSAIRLHRERRPALRSPYGDSFFEEVREFLPHLSEALIVGGEPFLAPETFRLLELVAELNPGLHCTIVTNGTRFDRRVAKALDAVRCSIVVSLDAADPALFERIRVGASHAAVMHNLGRFAEYCRRRGTAITINHCLMPQNYHDFLPFLDMAERRGIKVNVSVVREPAEYSLTSLDDVALERIHRRLLDEAPPLLESLELNRDVLLGEMARIRAWREAGGDQRLKVRGSSLHRILMFRRAGARRAPGEQTLAEQQLSNTADQQLTVGPGDIIRSVSPSLADLIGDAAADLPGQPVLALQSALVDWFGPMKRWDLIGQDDDRAEVRASFPDVELQLVMDAERDEAGWADSVRMTLRIMSDQGPQMPCRRSVAWATD